MLTEPLNHRLPALIRIRPLLMRIRPCHSPHSEGGRSSHSRGRSRTYFAPNVRYHAARPRRGGAAAGPGHGRVVDEHSRDPSPTRRRPCAWPLSRRQLTPPARQADHAFRDAKRHGGGRGLPRLCGCVLGLLRCSGSATAAVAPVPHDLGRIGAWARRRMPVAAAAHGRRDASGRAGVAVTRPGVALNRPVVALTRPGVPFVPYGETLRLPGRPGGTVAPATPGRLGGCTAMPKASG